MLELITLWVNKLKELLGMVDDVVDVAEDVVEAVSDALDKEEEV